MEAGEDPAVFLVKVLEELDSAQHPGVYQDLCKALCARLDLPQLARLRGVLFRTACLDPSFPATLFQDKVKGAVGQPHSKKITVAADVVTIFNLLQRNGGEAKDKPPGGERADGPFGQGHPSGCPSTGRQAGCEGCAPFVPAPRPRFLLGVSPEARARAASLDRLQALGPYPAAGPHPCEMQSTYFPMSPDHESVSDPDSPSAARAARDTFPSGDGPFAVRPCVQKRNVFKEDLRDPRAVSPGRGGPAGRAKGERGAPQGREAPHKAPFLHHSFEMPYASQYLHPVYPPGPGARRAKHESLDDLQASTYFGPTPVTGTPEAGRGAGRPGKHTAWPAKSWSLNTEQVPDFGRSFPGAPSPDQARYLEPSSPASGYAAPDRCPACLPPAQGQQPDRLTPPELSSPVHLDGHAPAPKVTAKGGGRQLSSDTSSVGTQTEPLPPDPTAAAATGGPSGARRAGRPSDDALEAVGDDISDLFRFLDDVSVSGSTAGAPSSRYNSTGSLSRLPRSDGDSSPERGRGPRPQDTLEASVGRLVLRVRDVEQKLAALWGVREELSQVLGRLGRLDQKRRPPGPPDLHSLTSEAASDGSVSPRRPALRKGLPAGPSSRSLTEDSAPESKVASVAHSPRDWRAVGYAGRGGLGRDGGTDGGPGKSTEWPRKAKEADRQYDGPPHHRPPQQPKDGLLVEQVFSPHPYPAPLKAHVKTSPLYTDMRLTELAEVKRGPPSWAVEAYARAAGDKGKLAALDLQTQESLNPNNLEYWMEDVYTPGYDSLLKHKEAEFRRAKVCKMVALVAAATCTVILVIVVPICTMKS